MRKLRLTTIAETSLNEIIEFTLDKFGLEQALVYKEELITFMEKLCTSPFTLGHSCAALFSDETNKSVKLRYILISSHYVIYSENDSLIIIYDFVHKKRNLPLLLKNIELGRLK